MSFPPLSASHRSGSTASPSPYTARIPRPPSGAEAYHTALANYGGGGLGASGVAGGHATPQGALRRQNSARSAATGRSSRAGSAKSHSKRRAGGAQQSEVPNLPDASPLATAGSLANSPTPQRRAASARTPAGAKAGGSYSASVMAGSALINGSGNTSPSQQQRGGVYYQHQPAPPAPRSLFTERVVDVDAATAPITAASSYRHLLRRPNDYQSSIQFQNEPRQLTAYSAYAEVPHPLSSVAETYGGNAHVPAPPSPRRGAGRGNSPTSPHVSPSRGISIGATSVSPGGVGDSVVGASAGPSTALPPSPASGGTTGSPTRVSPDEAAAESGSLFRPSGRHCVRAALSGRDCDAVEVAYSVFGPALAHLSTAQTLSTLERECHVAQLEGRFIDAQICHDLLNQVANNCSDRAQRAVQDKIRTLQPVQAKHEENRAELVQFTKLWEKEMAAYDAKGEAVVAALCEKHQRELHEASQLLESQLAATRPHFSRRVIDLRAELGKLVALKRFREADSINKDLVALERAEGAAFEQSLAKRYRKAIKVSVGAHQRELESLKGRIQGGRDELLRQRRADYQTLLQRHAIRASDVDHKVRAQLQQEHKHLERQAVLMARRPANAVDMFSEYEDLLRRQKQQQQQQQQQRRQKT